MESLQAVEVDLIKEKNRLEDENLQLVEKCKKNIEKMKQFQVSTAQKSELLEKAWEKEKLSLQVSGRYPFSGTAFLGG